MKFLIRLLFFYFLFYNARSEGEPTDFKIYDYKPSFSDNLPQASLSKLVDKSGLHLKQSSPNDSLNEEQSNSSSQSFLNLNGKVKRGFIRSGSGPSLSYHARKNIYSPIKPSSTMQPNVANRTNLSNPRPKGLLAKLFSTKDDWSDSKPTRRQWPSKYSASGSTSSRPKSNISVSSDKSLNLASSKVNTSSETNSTANSKAISTSRASLPSSLGGKSSGKTGSSRFRG